MKKLLACACLAVCIAGAASGASIKIDAGKPGVKFSPHMYGLFFEEINHAGDGGIYAELVQNRSFEDYQIPEGLTLGDDGMAVSPAGFKMKPNLTNPLPAWSSVGSGRIELDKNNPLNDKNPSCLRLEANGPGAGIANEGYWGMNIKSGEKYNLSLFAKCDSGFKGKLSVSLESSDGKAISMPVSISGLGSGWKQFKAALTASGSDPKARLVITSDAKGTIWFDVVSLFPQNTYKNRPNGLRPDLVKMMLDSKPTFMRWPGGCIVEGVSIGNMYRWKDTIGPIEQRPGKWNLWGYRRTDGFGYHEFLQFCEDTGLAPMFVFNAGMSCQWRNSMTVPVSELKPYIDDALDAIEYAIGPADSKWGSARAKNGHPKPFKLEYVEIGNENWGDIYDQHYKLFYDAIKAKYPNMKTIADARVGSAPVEMADDHFYNSPEWFIANNGLYDNYNRKDPPVYAGEYCSQGSSGTGNIYGGLAEAALLLGFERNADVVRMTSYAPLLVNQNNRAFNPDSIVYDSSRVYGTGSYYVYSMLGNNLPDVTLPVMVDVPSVKAEFPGKIGVGTLSSDVEFKDIKVTKNSREIYSFDLAKGLPDTGRRRSRWEIANGVIRRVNTNGEGNLMLGENDWVDYTLTLKARKVNGEDGFTVYFSNQQGTEPIRWVIGGWANTQHGLQVGGRDITEPVSGSLEKDKWYDIKVEISGSHVKCYLDGALIHDTERKSTSLFAAAGKKESTGEIILKVCNPTGETYKVNLSIAGISSVAPRGTETVLSSGKPTDENSLDNPTRFAPVTKEIDGLGVGFDYTFKPWSLTILRLSAK